MQFIKRSNFMFFSEIKFLNNTVIIIFYAIELLILISINITLVADFGKMKFTFDTGSQMTNYLFFVNLLFSPFIFLLHGCCWSFSSRFSSLLSVSNSDKGARLSRNLCYLIWLRHLVGSRAVTKRIFLSEKTYFHSCVRTYFWVTI